MIQDWYGVQDLWYHVDANFTRNTVADSAFMAAITLNGNTIQFVSSDGTILGTMLIDFDAKTVKIT